MRILTFSLAIALVIASTQTWACRRPAVEQFQRENDARERKQLQQMIADTAESADLIFIGRVLDITVIQDKEHKVETHSPKFEALKVLKGTAPDSQILSWEVPLDSIHVTCGPIGEFHVIDLLPTYRYLVFARAGKIIHARQIIDWPQDVSYEEELQIAQQHVGK
jgi:hypothetical protein